jgi:COMPASS component BRE2
MLPPSGAPNAMNDFHAKSSPAPSIGTTTAERSKRNKRDSRKKREAKGLDPEHAPPKKKSVTVPSSARPSTALSILRPMLLADPRSPDILPPQPRQMNFVYRKNSEVLNDSWDFYEIVDKLTNKNGFRYSYAIADSGFPHIKYRQTDMPPFHARFSYEDSPAAIAFTKDALAVATNDPWHSARANVCAREGTYYYEARVISGIVKGGQPKGNSENPQAPSRGHIRLGFARREAELDVNVGVDCYGYGIRDVNGEVINRMRCEYFFPKGESINEGDVIGLLITLPSLSLHKKVVEGTYDPSADDGNQSNTPPVATNTIRDRIPFHLKSDFCWQQSNIFPSKQLRDYAFNLKETPTFGPPSPLNSEDASLRTLPGSSITIYKNGVKIGTPFKELYAFLPPASRLTNGTNNLGIGERENADDGMIGYFPTVSCYGGGAVECRFEPPWWFGIPPTDDEHDGGGGSPVRAFGERFNDQIVEDVVADIVDEVEASFLWSDVVDGADVESIPATAPTASSTTDLNGSAMPAAPEAGGVAPLGGADVVTSGVGAVYESAAAAVPAPETPAAVADSTLATGSVGPGHTTFEDALTTGTPDAESSAPGGDGDPQDEDVEMT